MHSLRKTIMSNFGGRDVCGFAMPKRSFKRRAASIKMGSKLPLIAGSPHCSFDRDPALRGTLDQ